MMIEHDVRIWIDKLKQHGVLLKVRRKKRCYGWTHEKTDHPLGDGSRVYDVSSLYNRFSSLYFSNDTNG